MIWLALLLLLPVIGFLISGCGYCTCCCQADDEAAAYVVTFTGWGNGTCLDCDALNASFNVPFRSSAGTVVDKDDDCPFAAGSDSVTYCHYAQASWTSLVSLCMGLTSAGPELYLMRTAEVPNVFYALVRVESGAGYEAWFVLRSEEGWSCVSTDWPRTLALNQSCNPLPPVGLCDPSAATCSVDRA